MDKKEAKAIVDRTILLLLKDNPMSRARLDLMMHIVAYNLPEVEEALETIGGLPCPNCGEYTLSQYADCNLPKSKECPPLDNCWNCDFANKYYYCSQCENKL